MIRSVTFTLSCTFVALFFLASNLLFAQDQIQIQPSGTMTWEQLRQIDAQQAGTPEPKRTIHAPMPGPGPRELGSPNSPIETDVNSATHQPLSASPLTRQPVSPMVVPTLSFDALLDNNTSIPPDTYGSAGPSHLMTMLNTEVRIQSKAGSITSTVTLATFWSSIAGSKFDPKVNYDAGSGRWLAVCDANGNLATSKICFAISATSDPTGSWTFYEFDADATDATWADYPGFGHNATWIAITHNMFTVAASPAYVGAKMWVIDKSTALTGGPLTTTVFPTDFDVSGGVDGFTLQPCVTFGTEPNLYIVDNTGWGSGGTFMVRISRITGTGAAPAWSVQPGSTFASSGLFFVANNFNFSQIDAPQSGIGTLVETNDPRMLNAVFRNSRIWCTHSAGLPVAPATSTRTAAFWYQLDPAAMPTPITQSGALDGGVGVHHFFPSITANSSDDACIGFSRSDATKFVEAVYSGRLALDPLGTMPFGVQVFKLGESSYSKFFGGTRNRWGDYSNTCIDPSDDLTFWTIQEYAGTNVGGGVNDGRWGTRWAKIVPPEDLPIQLASFTGSVVNGNSVRLDWRTISETNNYGFELEKSLGNANNYQTIPNSFLAGHGTTSEPHAYTFTEPNVGQGTWYYRLKQIDLNGNTNYHEGVRVDVLLTGVESSALPAVVSLQQNYPNPFNPTTTIRFQIPDGSGHRPNSSFATVKVFDLLGREVATLVNGVMTAGEHEVQLDASNLASGVYTYRLAVGDNIASRKLIVAK